MCIDNCYKQKFQFLNNKDLVPCINQISVGFMHYHSENNNIIPSLFTFLI